MFIDRDDAARALADKLARYKADKNAVVLAIPRGGVVIGAVLAEKLGLPLDVLLTKKIGHPMNPEYAVGVVNLHGEIIDADVVERDRISPAYIEQQIGRIRSQLRKRLSLYQGDRPVVSLKGKTAIICDDGIATGNTMIAAVRLARQEGARRVVAAAPVSSSYTAAALRNLVDEAVFVIEPENFFAIGQFYENFDQVEDEEAIRLLNGAALKSRR